MGRKRKKKITQTFTSRSNKSAKSNPNSSVVTRVLPLKKLLVGSKNDSAALINQINQDSIFCTIAHTNASVVLHSVIADWAEELRRSNNNDIASIEQSLPNFSAQSVWEHIVKRNYTPQRHHDNRHPRIQTAHGHVRNNLRLPVVKSSNDSRQATYVAVSMMTDFLNFMNNLPIYIEWFARDFLMIKFPNLRKSDLRTAAELFRLRVCNIPHTRQSDVFDDQRVLQLIKEFQQILGVTANTKVDEKFIKKYTNKCLHLICHLSNLQLSNSTTEYQCRQIPICPIAKVAAKPAFYNTRELYFLLKSCGLLPESVKQVDKDSKEVILPILSKYIGVRRFDKKDGNLSFSFRSFRCNSVSIWLMLDKTKTPKKTRTPSSSNPPLPQIQPTRFDLPDGRETLFYAASDEPDCVRIRCANGEVLTGNDLAQERGVVAVDPGVIQNTAVVVSAKPNTTQVVVHSTHRLTTRQIYEKACIKKSERITYKTFVKYLSTYNNSLSQRGSLKSPHPQSNAVFCDISSRTTWPFGVHILPENATQLVNDFLGGDDDGSVQLVGDLMFHIQIKCSDKVKNFHLTAHIEKTRIIDGFAAQVVKAVKPVCPNPLILIEAGKFPVTAGGNLAVPMNQITTSLSNASNGRIAYVPTFRTSSVCTDCLCPLQSLKKKFGRTIRGQKHCPQCKRLFDRDVIGATNTGASAIFHHPIFNRHLPQGQGRLSRKTLIVPSQLPCTYPSRRNKLDQARLMLHLLSTPNVRTRFLSLNNFDDIYELMTSNAGKININCWVGNFYRVLVCLVENDVPIIKHWLRVLSMHEWLHRSNAISLSLFKNLMNGDSPFFNIPGGNRHKSIQYVSLLAHAINVNRLIYSIPSSEDVSDHLSHLADNILGLEQPPPPSKYQKILLALTRRSENGLRKIRELLRSSKKPEKKDTTTTNFNPRYRNSHSQPTPVIQAVVAVQPPPPPVTVAPTFPGIHNLGNTCYLNASLQTLFSLPLFLQKLYKSYKEGLKLKKEMPLTKALLEVATTIGVLKEDDVPLIDSMVAHSHLPNSDAANPIHVKTRMEILTNKFHGTVQNDAHEFLGDLVDCLHDELAKPAPPDEDGESAAPPAVATPILPTDEYFHLKVRVCLECNSCGYSRSKDELYRNLSVDVGEGNEVGWSAEQSFSEFFQDGEVREVKCEKCETGTTATQTSMEIISRPPKAILLHFKRFDATLLENGEFVLKKNRVKLPLKETLSVSSSHFSLGNNNDDEELNLQYQLRGVANHHGKKAQNGHYSACCKRTVNNKEHWVFFDDKVGKIRSSTYNTSTYGTCPDEENNHKDCYLALYELTVNDEPEIIAVVSNEVESVAMEVEEDQMEAEKEVDSNDVEDIVQAPPPVVSAAVPPQEENPAAGVKMAWVCSSCTFENADELSKYCQMCGFGRQVPSHSRKVMEDKEEDVQMEVDDEVESNEVEKEVESKEVDTNNSNVLGNEQQVQRRGIPCCCQGEQHLCRHLSCPCTRAGLRCTSECRCRPECRNKCIQKNSLFDYFSKKK